MTFSEKFLINAFKYPKPRRLAKCDISPLKPFKSVFYSDMTEIKKTE